MSEDLTKQRPETSHFPGATAVSGLEVYDWEAADGCMSGSPHVHLLCTEAYVVIEGEGSLQTLTSEGFAETPLHRGTVAWFSPGTIHRAVNGGGDLRIIVVMQNAGLPEAGDAVLTFPTETLATEAEYVRAAAQPSDESSARDRRNLAVAGFLHLVRSVESGDNSALEAFYRRALELRADRFDDWRKLWTDGPLRVVQRTGEQLEALQRGDISHLLDAGVTRAEAPEPKARRWGMCGRLETYPAAARLSDLRTSGDASQ